MTNTTMTRKALTRKTLTRKALTGFALAGALLLGGCGAAENTESTAQPAEMTETAETSEPMTESTEPMTESTETDTMDAPEAMLPGAYLTLAEYQDQMADRAGSTVVYFFHATWCPTCRATDESVTADGLPAGLTLVKIDFDSESDLRQQYGITQQHTFVQVDADGSELAKWTGSITGDEIKAETV